MTAVSQSMAHRPLETPIVALDYGANADRRRENGTVSCNSAASLADPPSTALAFAVQQISPIGLDARGRSARCREISADLPAHHRSDVARSLADLSRLLRPVTRLPGRGHRRCQRRGVPLQLQSGCGDLA